MTSLLKAWLLNPLALLFLLSLLLLAWVFIGRRSAVRRRRWSALLIWLLLFLICSAPVIVNPMVAMLEDTYLSEPQCLPGSHLIVLGGGVDSRIRDASEFGRMSNATLTRATAAARLAVEASYMRVVVAGGAIGKVAEAEVIASYLQRLGVKSGQIVKESESANTRENALNVARLLEAESVVGPVSLVTSAMHMPRALLSFRRVLADTGIEVCPVSVDVQALKGVPWFAVMPQTTALSRFDKLLHEAVALVIYRLKGWL